MAGRRDVVAGFPHAIQHAMLLRRGRTAADSRKVPGLQRIISCCAAPGRQNQSLPAHLPDKLLKFRKLLLDEVDADLILELERLLVEFLLRHADENLRLVERQCVKKDTGLAERILQAPAAERPAGHRLDRDRLADKRLVLDARQPIDRILEAARDAVVVLWGPEDLPI